MSQASRGGGAGPWEPVLAAIQAIFFEPGSWLFMGKYL